jgi:hypothetical protein
VVTPAVTPTAKSTTAGVVGAAGAVGIANADDARDNDARADNASTDKDRAADDRAANVGAEGDRAGEDADMLGEPTREFAAAKPSASTGTDADTSTDADAEDTSPSGGTASTSGTSDAKAGTGQVTVVPGVPRYHEPNCILIRFMPDDDVQKMTIPEAKEAGCTPCAACQPEG